jgi:hypothetical protein
MEDNWSSKYSPSEKKVVDLTTPIEEKHQIYIEPKEDSITDFAKGISFKTCDGKDVATMEEVMLYNQMYYDKMKNIDSKNTGMHK